VESSVQEGSRQNVGLAGGATSARFGGILTELHVPDRSGKLGDVVLGFDNLTAYLKGHPFFGATVGRVANRIAKGKFTLDGKQLVKTIGTPNVPGSDSTHFFRPTFMAFNTDGSWYNSDGYLNTRVVHFDKNDSFLGAWGEKGTNTGPNAKLETRPNYFNNVHGVGVDIQTQEVYVNDRGNRRIQVFDTEGRFLRQFTIDVPPDPTTKAVNGNE